MNLRALQHVSKHFHQLASAELYSSLDFYFSHGGPAGYFGSEAAGCYSLVDLRLAECLNTFALSEHNYAQYIKRFSVSMSEYDPDDIQRRVASKYHADEDANVFLNTLLKQMIRKAHSLEKFL